MRGPITLDCPLPVSYLSFVAERADNSVKLDWITAIEKNAKEFVVERSSDGKYFYSMGSVTALNQKGGSSYSFEDVHPLSGTTYYRLHQVDLNGDVYFSEIKEVQSKIGLLELNPNPANESVMVRQYHTEEGNVNLILYNSIGEEIKSITIESSSFKNGYVLDLSTISKGAYLLKVITSYQVLTERLIKE